MLTLLLQLLLQVMEIKSKIDAARIEVEAAEREYDLNRAAELKYSTLPKLEVRALSTVTCSCCYHCCCCCLQRYHYFAPSNCSCQLLHATMITVV
jgi:hypothetical protein